MHLLGFSEKESVFGLSKLSIFVTIHVVFIVPSRVPWRCAKCIWRWLVKIVQQYLPRLVCQIGWRQLQSSVCEVSGFRGRVNFNWNVQNYKGVYFKKWWPKQVFNIRSYKRSFGTTYFHFRISLNIQGPRPSKTEITTVVIVWNFIFNKIVWNINRTSRIFCHQP